MTGVNREMADVRLFVSFSCFTFGSDVLRVLPALVLHALLLSCQTINLPWKFFLKRYDLQDKLREDIECDLFS